MSRCAVWTSKELVHIAGAEADQDSDDDAEDGVSGRGPEERPWNASTGFDGIFGYRSINISFMLTFCQDYFLPT